MTTISIVSLILFGALAFLAIVTVYIPRFPSAVAGYGAFAAAWLSDITAIEVKSLIFWGIATCIATAIRVMLPRTIARSRAGVAYISGGTMTAVFVGMLFNTNAGVILAALCGAVLGAIAFSNTEKGRPMEFPSRKFFNYTAAKGLPVVVSLSMVAISLLHIISYFK